VSRDAWIVDAQMDLDYIGAEPAATAALEVGRLPHSWDAEEACVDRLGLSARRHRKLDVGDGPDHGTTLPDRLWHDPGDVQDRSLRLLLLFQTAVETAVAANITDWRTLPDTAIRA
jgi:hypothetical protein